VAHTVISSLLTAILFGGVAGAYDPSLDPREVSEAVAIGQSRIESARLRFHQPYRLPVNRVPIDHIDVVTPFRRVVLTAEAEVRAGNRLFGQREALAMLSGDGGRVQLFIEMTFHPLNTFVGVPAYVAVLIPAGSASAPIAAANIDRIPRYGMRIDGLPPGAAAPTAPANPQRAEPVLGGTVVASFDSGPLSPNGVYDVVVSESGKESARVRLDLARLR
jgi:hypothetical protein